MSAFMPQSAIGPKSDPDHPRLHQRPFSPAEHAARREVKAAAWRARELAGLVFGRVAASSLSCLRTEGPMRGLLSLDVPFDDLRAHRDREARFLAAVDRDPVLARVRLVYVIGPDLR